MNAIFGDKPELLREFREGKREALEFVYFTYVRAIERYVRTLGRSSGRPELSQPSAVSDFIQEVFVRAFSPVGRTGYDGLRDYGGYLAGIARNCMADTLRSRRREVLHAPEALPLMDDLGESFENQGDPRVTAVLRSYLNKLKPRLRAVCEERFVLGRSQEDVARALGISRRALRTTEAHLRKGVRKALRSAGISLRDLNLSFSPGDVAPPIRIAATRCRP